MSYILALWLFIFSLIVLFFVEKKVYCMSLSCRKIVKQMKIIKLIKFWCIIYMRSVMIWMSLCIGAVSQESLLLSHTKYKKCIE